MGFETFVNKQENYLKRAKKLAIDILQAKIEPKTKLYRLGHISDTAHTINHKITQILHLYNKILDEKNNDITKEEEKLRDDLKTLKDKALVFENSVNPDETKYYSYKQMGLT